MNASTVASTAEAPTLRPVDLTARQALFTDARTAGTFADIPVTDAELTEIWELAKWAPTATNMQPLRVLYVRPGAGRERLIPHLSEGNRKKTRSAPAVAVLAVDTQFHDHLPEVFPFRPELKHTFAADDDRRTASGTFNAALQAGYFILAVRALGFAAGPMTGFDAAAVDAEFFADGRLHALVIINIGHPGAGAWRDRLPRLSHDDVLQWT